MEAEDGNGLSYTWPIAGFLSTLSFIAEIMADAAITFTPGRQAQVVVTITLADVNA
jgi:hypothetical protein